MKRSHCWSSTSIARSIVVIVLASTSVFIAVPAGAILSLNTVTFFENASGIDSVSSYQVASVATNLRTLASFNPAFSNVGEVFVDWTTAANGSGTHFADAATYSFASDVSLYAQWRLLPVFNTVTFFENRTLSDSVSAYQALSAPSQLTLFSSLTPAFSRAGYTFADWTTAANGSGTHFADGAAFDFASGVSLFAQWIATPNYTTNFASNGGIGSIASQSGFEGSVFALPTSSGLSYEGHSFTGWNTAANGTGTNAIPGTTYVLTGNQTLFAQWIPNVFTVTLLPDGGIGTPANLGYTFGTPALILPAPTLTGSVFMGWFTSQTGGVLVGLNGSLYTPSASITLYAQWSATALVITYSPNGGSISPATVNYIPGSSPVILPTPTLTGATFTGWFTAQTGGLLVGIGGASFTPVASQVLYAQWSQVILDTLTFDANGGSGSVLPVSGAHGSSITLPGQGGLLRAGFLLARWNTAAKGTGTSYLAGQTLTLTGSSTLYAQWTGHAPARLLGSVGSFRKNSAALTPALMNQVRHLASTIRAMKYHTVTLYGYTSATGLTSLNISLSRARASRVASYLRGRLAALHVAGVSINWVGEGAIGQRTSSSYSRVEVFVL